MKAAAFQYCQAHPVARWPAFLPSDPPPSLRGHYTRFIANTGQSAPDQCIDTFGLVLLHLYLFSCHHRSGSQVPCRSLAQIHASCTPVAACPVIRCPAGLSQKISAPLVLTTGLVSRRVIGRFAYARLSKPYMTWITTPFAIMLTTTAFHCGSLWLFEASP